MILDRLKEIEAVEEYNESYILRENIINLVKEYSKFKLTLLTENTIEIKSKYFGGFTTEITITKNTLDHFCFIYRGRKDYIHNPSLKDKQNALIIIENISREAIKYAGTKSYERGTIVAEFNYLINNLELIE